MDFIKICAISITGIILITAIPQKDKSINTIVSVSISLIVILYIFDIIYPYFETIKNTLQSIDNTDFSLLFKISGISILSQFVCDFAQENGNKILSTVVNLAGKITIAFLAIPVYIKVFEIIGQIII